MTQRGTPLELIAEFPTGSGPVPAIVLAPGQGYRLAMPALKQTAKQLLAHGIAVYRFNWMYFTQDPRAGKPSTDLSKELEDLHTVLGIVAALPQQFNNFGIGPRAYSFSDSPWRGCHFIKCRSSLPTALSNSNAQAVSTTMPAKTVLTSKVPSACRIR